MLINLRNALMTGKRKPTAKDYVQNGLYFLWDYKENVAWGDGDPSATQWVDLVSGKIWTGCSFTSDGCVFSAQKSASISSTPSFPSTYELCVARVQGSTQIHTTTAMQYLTVNGALSERGFIAQRYPTNTRQYVANVLLSQDLGTVPEDFHTIAASFTIDDGTPTAKYYLDGNLVSTKTSTDSIVVGGTLYLRIYPNNIFKRWTRYARALSASEIAANYTIDKARFGLPEES